MRTIQLYGKANCHLCDEAKALLDGLVRRVPFKVEVIDVEQDPVWRSLLSEHVPVIDVGGGNRLYWPFTADDVLRALDEAARVGYPPAVSGRTRAAVVVIDKAIYRFSNYWVPVLAFFIAIYAGLPLLAPILMAHGYDMPANLIYSVYQFLCHQLPSRSYFIDGYQVAYCERDTAIYLTLLAATLLFPLLRGRLKPLPWQWYIVLITPMAIDGLTQLVGLRSSNWQLRTITGALFGLGTAWLALPYVEEAFQDIRQSVSTKLEME
jgi:uncharacterized membrane protein/glutaredoxin